MYLEFPLWLIGLRTRLVFMRMWLRSLTSLSGLRIRCHYKLWQRSWMELRSGVAVVKAGSCSSYLTLVWEFPHATSVALKRKKKGTDFFALPFWSPEIKVLWPFGGLRGEFIFWPFLPSSATCIPRLVAPRSIFKGHHSSLCFCHHMASSSDPHCLPHPS